MSFLTVRHLAVALYYLSHWLGTRVHPLAGFVMKQINHVLTGADVAWQARIGPGLALYHPTGVVIGPDVVMGRGCVLQQGVTIGGRGGDIAPTESESPVIGDAVRFGPGACVLGPITVGSNVQIGANSVVLSSLPDDCTAVGAPAKQVRRRNDEPRTR